MITQAELGEYLTLLRYVCPLIARLVRRHRSLAGRLARGASVAPGWLTLATADLLPGDTPWRSAERLLARAAAAGRPPVRLVVKPTRVPEPASTPPPGMRASDIDPNVRWV